MTPGFFISAFAVVCFLILPFNKVDAQSVGTWEKTKEDKKEMRRFKNNYYHALTFVPFSGWVNYSIPPVTTNGYDPQVISEIRAWTFFSLGYQARYNLYNYRDWFSVSLSAEPYWDIVSRRSFGSASGSEDSNKKGVFLGVDLNIGHQSTFNNLNDRGLSVSGGLHFNKVADYPGTRAFFGRLTYRYVKYKASLWKAMKDDVDPHRQVSRSIGFQIGYGDDNGKPGVPYNTATEFRLILTRVFGY